MEMAEYKEERNELNPINIMFCNTFLKSMFSLFKIKLNHK